MVSLYQHQVLDSSKAVAEWRFAVCVLCECRGNTVPNNQVRQQPYRLHAFEQRLLEETAKSSGFSF